MHEYRESVAADANKPNSIRIMKTINPKTINEAVTQTVSESATICNADGYQESSGVTVLHITEPSMSDNDSVYVIGGTQHIASDIEYNHEAGELRSLAAGWTVKL